MRVPFEPMFDVRDWWDPTGTQSGWYDQKFTDDSSGGDASASPSGVATLASVGSATATGTGTVTAVGVSSLASVGSATATGAALVSPPGVTTTAAIGSADVTVSGVASPVGVAAVASVGTAVASAGSDGLASPAGVEMVASVGTAIAADTCWVQAGWMQAGAWVQCDLTEDAPVVSGGVGSWGRRVQTDEPGELRVSVTVFPFGVSATARVGRATATGDACVRVEGVSASTALGDVQAGADAVAEVAGVSMAAGVGQAAAFDVHVFPVLRYTPVVLETRSVADRAGNPIAAVVPPAAPVGHPPPEAIDRAWSELQADEDELLLLGVIA